uniref:ShKT domain-containing protein n=1 Tax=Heterorhabditis bacteriophora TaxID=37862 RepID=A0A1I7XJ43_HETBA
MRLVALSLSVLFCVTAQENATTTTPWKEPPRDCSDAPNKDIKQTCLMIRKMDRETRRRIARQAFPNGRGGPNWLQPIRVLPNARGQFAYHPYDCMTLLCLCPFFNGRIMNGMCILRNGFPLQIAFRKEYRMMTDDERNRWHFALNVLKRNGEYDRLSRQHLDVGHFSHFVYIIFDVMNLFYYFLFLRSSLFIGKSSFQVGIGSGAHSGPGFLPWHREYLKRFEIALRMVDPSVSIPYWDSVMDNYLPDPRDSIIFTNMFAGETDFFGNVVQGPFAFWPTLEGRRTILRQLGREGSLFNENQINNIVAQNTIESTLAFTAPQQGCPFPNNYGAIEYTHSNIHLWIGGDMKPPSTSANEMSSLYHEFSSQGGRMHAAKTIVNAIANPLNGTIPLKTNTDKDIKMTAPLFVDCYNRINQWKDSEGGKNRTSYRHPCCSVWASAGECGNQPEYMSQFCVASCDVCTPSYNTTEGGIYFVVKAFLKSIYCENNNSNKYF